MSAAIAARRAGKAGAAIAAIAKTVFGNAALRPIAESLRYPLIDCCQFDILRSNAGIVRRERMAVGSGVVYRGT
jgi:hypothetical protein